MGGVTALHDYYQEHILKFEENMKRKVEEMMERQRQLELNTCSTKCSVVHSVPLMPNYPIDRWLSQIFDRSYSFPGISRDRSLIQKAATYVAEVIF